MTYTPNTPQATQTIAFTQPLIQGNFQYIQTTFAQKEHSFNGNAPGVEIGAHLQCSMPNLGLTPLLRPGTNGIYYVEGGESRFLCGDNTTICRLTEGLAATSGYQWIGRVLIQWGFVSLPSGTIFSGTVNFPIAFPTECFVVQDTLTYATGNIPAGDERGCVFIQKSAGVSPTTTLFGYQFRSNGTRATGFYWTAIGN